MDGGSLSRRAILLVEDNLQLLGLFQGLLEEAGYAVTTASNGNEAFKLLLEPQHSFALLVTDVDLPGINGLQLAAAARQRSCSVILMSGRYDKDTMESLGGPNRFLAKPFPSHLLLSVIEEVLG